MCWGTCNKLPDYSSTGFTPVHDNRLSFQDVDGTPTGMMHNTVGFAAVFIKCLLVATTTIS